MERVKPLCTILLILVMCALGALDAISQDAPQVAFVLSINGTLEVRHTEAGDWADAKQRDPLYDGSQLRTGTGDKAMIIYPASGTRVLINENTTIEVHAEAASTGERPSVERTKLLFGEIYNQARGNYEVETPSAVASVRGTEFDAASTGAEDTFIGVEGLIEVMNQFGSVLLAQFQITTASENEGPSEPETLTENETMQRIGWIETVEPTWRLNMIPENGDNQEPDSGFTLSVFAYRDGSIDQNATFPLTEFGADSQTVEFSTDSGRTWNSQAPALTLVNGQATLMCRVTEEGQATITAVAEDAETAYLTLTVATPKDTKTLELIFTDPGGTTEKTLIWELEEK